MSKTEIVADSWIASVTVFVDHARVTRVAKHVLGVGPQRMEFRGLPRSLDPQSIRISGRAATSMKILRVDSKLAQQSELPVEQIQALEAELAQLKREEDNDADRLETLGKQIAQLDGLADSGRLMVEGLIQGKITLEHHSQLLDYLGRQRELLTSERRQRVTQRAERQKVISAKNTELSRLKKQTHSTAYHVGVEVDLKQAGEVEIELTYVVPNASWTPLYDIRLRGEQLELTYLAEVQQNTGEDWHGVNLTLSTARPTLATQLPILRPQYLSTAPAYPAAAAVPTYARTAVFEGERERKVDNLELFEAESANLALTDQAPMTPAQAETAQVQVSDAGNVTFRIAGSSNIPSDGTPQKTTIGIFPLQPTLDYVTVPKLNPVAIRRAKMENTTGCTLLPGLAQIFLADDFLGTSELPLIALDQQLKLFFGVDDRIQIQRRRTKQAVSTTFFKGRKHLEYAYEIRLHNHTEHKQMLTLVDQIPLSQSESVQVRLDLAEPKPTNHNDLNILIWRLELPAKQEIRVQFGFSVDHSPSDTLVGLETR